MWHTYASHSQILALDFRQTPSEPVQVFPFGVDLDALVVFEGARDPVEEDGIVRFSDQFPRPPTA